MTIIRYLTTSRLPSLLCCTMLLALSIYLLGHLRYSTMFPIFPYPHQLPSSPTKPQNPQITTLEAKTSRPLINSILDIYLSAGTTFRMFCPRCSPCAGEVPTRSLTMKEKSIRHPRSRAGVLPSGKDTRHNLWPPLTCGSPMYPALLGFPIWCVFVIRQQLDFLRQFVALDSNPPLLAQ